MNHEAILKFWFSVESKRLLCLKTGLSSCSERVKRRNGWRTDTLSIGFDHLLDQFLHYTYLNSLKAFTQDNDIFGVCVNGIEKQGSRKFSLIHRIFYYFPFHCIRKIYIIIKFSSVLIEYFMIWIYQESKSLMYTSFFKFANYYYNVIRCFGQFP
ncbi:MAG: DUF924 family protein [Coxiella-like endosymbiont]